MSGRSGGIGQAATSILSNHSDWVVTGLVRNPETDDVRVDVTWDDVRIAAALSALGSVDALICAHGADIVSSPYRQASYEERLRMVCEVDIIGTIKLVRHALKQMVPHGTIILIGSDEVECGRPGETAELYAAAKGAVISFGRSLAATLGKDAQVYIVKAGWVLTRWGESLSPQHRQLVVQRSVQRRWQSPEAVARTMERLLMHPEKYPSGSVVPVDPECR